MMLATLVALAAIAPQPLVIRAGTLHTMAGPPIQNAVVLVEGGKIAAVGTKVEVPRNARVIEAKVVTPGLIDAKGTVGLTGIYNIPQHDQDHLDQTGPMQPELRVFDAYNPLEPLVDYVRQYGTTTVHIAPSPGTLIGAQTAVVKTAGKTVDAAGIVREAMVTFTLDPASESGGGAPGTRAKQMSMLRTELMKAQDAIKKPPTTRNLRQEALIRVLKGEEPVLVYANKVQDIANALRLRQEFGFRMVLDSGAEAYLVAEDLAKAGVPVILHPTMARTYETMANATYESAALLRKAGVLVAMQTGFEDYVPKTRVLLFEASLLVANGLTFEQTLATVTRDAAKVLGVDSRIGTIEKGKDADFALFDGDPFEYTSHCTGTVVNGEVVFSGAR